jgi:hypothetical protein
MGGDAYLGAHVEEALAEDGRVAEQGLHASVTAEAIVVSGAVSDEARKAAVAEVVAPLLGGRTFVDLTVVAGGGEPPVEHV